MVRFEGVLFQALERRPGNLLRVTRTDPPGLHGASLWRRISADATPHGHGAPGDQTYPVSGRCGAFQAQLVNGWY